MLVSHIKNLWTLPPPTTWPQEAPPLGWLPFSRQSIPVPRFTEGGGPFPTANIVLFSQWGCPERLCIFLVLLPKVSIVIHIFPTSCRYICILFFLGLLSFSIEVNLAGKLYIYLWPVTCLFKYSSVLCPVPNWHGVQTCVCFYRLIQLSDFASQGAVSPMQQSVSQSNDHVLTSSDC